MTYPLNPFKRRTLDDGLRLKTITSFEYMGTPAEPPVKTSMEHKAMEQDKAELAAVCEGFRTLVWFLLMHVHPAPM